MKVLLIFVAFVATVRGRVLPDNFPVCKKSDPHINQCIIKGLESLRPYLANGIPEIRLPSLDPYNLATLKLDKDLQNIHVKAVIKNGIGYGGRNFQIKQLKANVNDDNNYKGELTLLLPHLRVTADYEIINAKVLNFEDKGSSGKFEGNFTDVKAEVSGTAKVTTKDGAKHLQIVELNTIVTLGSGHVQIHDSKGGAIGDLATVFFNTDSPTILKALEPLISEIATLTVKNIVAKVVKRVPLEEVFEL